MKNDIQSKADIELLVKTFYSKVITDDVIGYVFTAAIKVNWERHLPVMYDFWENTLFYTGSYDGNPMFIHKNIHKHTPLSTQHFERWINLFTETVDLLFEGNKAALAKQRAISIATVMQLKILDSLPVG